MANLKFKTFCGKQILEQGLINAPQLSKCMRVQKSTSGNQKPKTPYLTA